MREGKSMRKHSLNNLKIRNKLLLIYLLCVLIPIILTDAFIMINVGKNARESQKREFQNVIDRVEYNLRETVNRCLLFTSNLYTDQSLDEFLNYNYRTYEDYYLKYTKMLRSNNFSYNYNYGLLSKIVIIADNNTIISGGRIATLDMVKDTEWYKAYEAEGNDTFLYIYYDESKKFLPGSGPCRTISVMRKMDSFGSGGIKKLMKLDIDYNIMLTDVLNEKTDAEIYVRNSNYIIFSNLPNTNGRQQFPEASSIDGRDFTMSKKFTAGNQEWEVVILADETYPMGAILSNKGVLAIILLNLFIPTILIYFVGASISRRLTTITAYLEKVENEQFEVINYHEGEDEIGKLIRSYNLMVIRIKELIEVVFKRNAEKQALELARKQAELKAIQSQVNPHFLFNTLESIRMRSLLKNEKETADIIGELSVLFRKSMNWGPDYITIEEEISFINNYINIQRYRYGDKIRFYHYVMDDCMHYRIPKLTISSLVENACIHGIEATEEEGVIFLNITRNEQHLFIEISDNGSGFGKDRLEELRWMIKNADIRMLNESTSTGMLNSYLRLKMYCDSDILFDIDSAPGKGTDITIVLPLSRLSIGEQPNNMQSKEG
jgi:two-component system sensor histidine kinase YesM